MLSKDKYKYNVETAHIEKVKSAQLLFYELTAP